jgi:hypothetical protein
VRLSEAVRKGFAFVPGRIDELGDHATLHLQLFQQKGLYEEF